MNNNMIFAEYENQTFECSLVKGGKEIKLLSDIQLNGFTKGIERYYLKVDRVKCGRVYKKTFCFKYYGDSFLVRDEMGDKVLLETGPRSYDLIALGFERILNDTFQKWVSKLEGELYWAYTEY